MGVTARVGGGSLYFHKNNAIFTTLYSNRVVQMPFYEKFYFAYPPFRPFAQ